MFCVDIAKFLLFCCKYDWYIHCNFSCYNFIVLGLWPKSKFQKKENQIRCVHRTTKFQQSALWKNEINGHFERFRTCGTMQPRISARAGIINWPTFWWLLALGGAASDLELRVRHYTLHDLIRVSRYKCSRTVVS